MSKSVALKARIILGGQDVSDLVTRWKYEAKIGELNVVELDFLKKDEVFKIDRLVDGSEIAVTANGITYTRYAKITVNDVDISSHVNSWAVLHGPRAADIVQLVLCADRDILQINGGYPWEAPADGS